MFSSKMTRLRFSRRKATNYLTDLTDKRLWVVSLRKRPSGIVSWIAKCKSGKNPVCIDQCVDTVHDFPESPRMHLGFDKFKTILEAPDFPTMTRCDSVSLIVNCR